MNVNQKASTPVDFFFSSETHSPYCNVLKKKIAELLSRKNNHRNELKTERNEFKLIMVLHIDEIIIQTRKFLINKSNLLGPSENDPIKLAK